VELASLLDGPVVHSEWTEACARAGITPEMAVVDSLLSSGLARCPTRDPQSGWSLVHWTFREAIEQRAGAVGRMPALHRACAWLLAERDAPTMALRLARHLLDAGEDTAALEPLLIAAKQLSQNGAYRKGSEVLAVREAAIERLKLVDDAPERLRGLRLATHFAQATRNFERAEVLIQEMMTRSSQPADRVLTLQQLCRLHRNKGQLMEAHGLNQQALRLAEDLQRPLLIAHSHLERGNILMLEGYYERAEAAFLIALRHYEQTSDARSKARTLSGLGRLCNRTHRWDEAIQYIERARQVYSSLKDRLSEIACLNDLGESARFSTKYEEAEGYYRAALDALRNTGHIAESITEINLALIWLAQGRFAEAERVLAAEQFRHEEAGQHGTAGLLYAYRLPGLVSLGQWSLAAATAQKAQQAAEGINLHDADAASLAAQAARIARASGRAPLADALQALSAWHKP
jgi:tetratricopeptide (TPR) repeat protein